MLYAEPIHVYFSTVKIHLLGYPFKTQTFKNCPLKSKIRARDRTQLVECVPNRYKSLGMNLSTK